MNNLNFSSISNEEIEIKFVPYSVDFLSPFKSSEGEISRRTGALVRVSLGSLVGYGEASPLPGYSRDSLEQVLVELQLLSQRRPSVEEFLYSSVLPSLQFALSTALGDLLGKIENKPLRQLLSPESLSSVKINQLGESPSSRPLTKLKVSPGNCLEVTEKMDSVSETRFRLDANRTFGFEESINFFKDLSKFNIEYVEEPFKSPTLAQLEEFQSSTGLCVALDESLYLGDCHLESFLSSGAVAALVIKPGFLGSIQKTVEASSLARKLAKKVIFSSGFDFYFGMACNIELAAALSRGEEAGLDTFRYLDLPEELPKMGWDPPSIDCSSLPGLGLGEKAEEIFQFFKNRTS